MSYNNKINIQTPPKTENFVFPKVFKLLFKKSNFVQYLFPNVESF